MLQYLSIKKKYPDSLLLFRVGDFYETFGEDAIKSAKILNIILTKRANGSSNVELAGFPHHSLNTYLPKLVKAGQRVAICEQLEDPKKTKKIVKRGVTELITPGVSLNDEVLDTTKNNFLASVVFGDKMGVSFLDISTGEFLIAEGDYNHMKKLINNFSPSEILYSKSERNMINDKIPGEFYFYPVDDWIFDKQFAFDQIVSHFKINSLKGFGIDNHNEGVIAAGSILYYLNQNKQSKLNHIINLKRLDKNSFVWLDNFTIKNLELLPSSDNQGTNLINVIDKTCTPMGARMIRHWVLFPLKDMLKINNRLNFVDFFSRNNKILEESIRLLSEIGDLERMLSKISTLRISPRELNKFKESLIYCNALNELLLKNKNFSPLKDLFSIYNPSHDIIERIDDQLDANAPVQLVKGGVMSSGVSEELDSYRKLALSSEKVLDQIKNREIDNTGISSLKIAYNNVFGYYLEVRNTHKDKVPDNWIRKQTLVSAERYITEELKDLEFKIINAKSKIQELESDLYYDLVNSISSSISQIQKNAFLIAQIDCLSCFSVVSSNNNYSKPLVDDSFRIEIKNGRHPVIESVFESAQEYIPNDIFLDDKKQQIIMITGPNMSGKSAILRQTALIVLMAQIGCFVPAEYAQIGLVDKIFTRVGASDNISQGESTFMVEMNETASILNNLSNRSLILLDEIGRGTSTFDGVSIAWAIAEYLHQSSFRSKTLFATHYHELNKMSEQFSRIKNFNVSVKEIDNEIVFLRKLKSGGVEHSFGIHVARMAGMPKSLLQRAKEILISLESSRTSSHISTKKDQYQLSFIQLDDPIIDEIKMELSNIDIDNLTPVEALMKLHEIKRKIGIVK
ncbi:MAG: DNA mismatch repair protein MutS [Flavobacteriales bacterium TMED191]|nr:MAG: DNA mismatch repair protein MutS [Flavobacteriales bacterium TMED191]